MKARDINALSKLCLFVFPLLIVALILLFTVLQYNDTKKMQSKITQTEEMITYLQNILSDPEKIDQANINATVDFLNDRIKLNLSYFETHFNYNIFLIAPNGNIFDILDIMTKEKEAADKDPELSEPLSFSKTDLGTGAYSILIIESSSFLNGKGDGLTYEFPEELFERNAQRLGSMTESELISDSASNLKLNALEGANYSLLEIKFTLTQADGRFQLILPLNWFKNLTCQSITIEA